MKRSTLLRTGVAIVAVLALAAVGVAATQETKVPDRETVVGYFADAGSLNDLNQVRAAGVEVGTVRQVELVDGNARVTMEVDPGVLPLHRDARLTIRPVNLLGELYVEVDPGSPEQSFLREAVIPDERTELAASLQDVINTFDDPTPTALAALLTTLGEGMENSGAEAAAAINALAPTMRRAEDLGHVLRGQNHVLGELVDRVQPVAKALAAGDGKNLDRLVGSTEQMLSTLAANQRALDATLTELPTTLTEARRTLRQLAGAADATTPTLKAVRPVTDDLTEISAELQRFADAADPALASLHPVLERADELLEQAGPAAEQLRKAGPDLRATAEQLRPLGNVLLDQHLGDLMAFVKKWSLSTNDRDALGHYFRGVVFVTPKTLEDLATAVVPTQPADTKDTGNASPVPVEPGNALPDALTGGSGERDPDNATGLTPKQEQSMLDQLLGGA